MKKQAQTPAHKPSSAKRQLLGELLVLRAQEGSSEAFGQLVELWQESLWRHARSMTGSTDAAWDVMQESWMAIAKGIGALKDPNLFRRWAYTIVTRSSATRLRRLPPEQSQDPGSMEHYAEEPASEPGREQAIASLRSALLQLKREDRVLVSLRYFENFELWELSKILCIPEGTLKSRLHRIRNELKYILGRINYE